MDTDVNLDPRISALKPLRAAFVFQVIATVLSGVMTNIFPVFFGYLQTAVWIYFGAVLFKVGNNPELNGYGAIKLTSLVIFLYGYLTTPDFIYHGNLPLTVEEIKNSNDGISANFNKFILLMVLQTILLVFIIISFSIWFNKIIRKIRIETNNHDYKAVNVFKYSTVPLTIGILFRIIAFNNIISTAEIISEKGRLPHEESGRIATIDFEITLSYIASFAYFALIIISYLFYFNTINPENAFQPSSEPHPFLSDSL